MSPSHTSKDNQSSQPNNKASNTNKNDDQSESTNTGRETREQKIHDAYSKLGKKGGEARKEQLANQGASSIEEDVDEEDEENMSGVESR